MSANKNLTASNERSVIRLVSDIEAKARWQSVAAARGVMAADVYVSNLRCQPVKTVKAARFYW